MKRKLKGGMIGGRPGGAFIGPVHRMAATLDNETEFIAGCFSSDPVLSKKGGEDLFLNPERVYGTWQEMVKKEEKYQNENRLDFVSIVTPNVFHFEIAKAFLEAGFHVIMDKPMCTSLKQAKELEEIVKKTGRVFVLTHNYTGYPMVKQAKKFVKEGVLGKINKVVVEYPQGWLSGMLTDPKSSISGWRMNPEKAGPSCVTADIGIHAENLARYITGLEIEELCADVSTFIETNPLEDDINVLIHFKNGARGILTASQISTGEENGLNIRIYGTKASIAWFQEDPNYLVLKDPSGFKKIFSKGNPILCEEAKQAARLPFGHPDGFIEAFANIYREAFRAIREFEKGNKNEIFDFPTVRDGVIGNAFIETVLESRNSKEKWVKMKI